MSVLVTSENFRLFVNTLTPDVKDSRRNMQIFWQQLPTPLSQKKKIFFDFLLHFWNVQEIHNILKKQKSILIQILPKLLHPKKIFTLASKRSLIRTPFVNQRVNGFEAMPKLTPHHYFSIFPGIRYKLSWKMSALVIFEIFRLFVNTFTPDDKYSRRNMQIFWQQLQTLLPQEKEIFWGFFIAFPKCEWNLEDSEKKEEYPSLIITKIIASEIDIYLSV